MNQTTKYINQVKSWRDAVGFAKQTKETHYHIVTEELQEFADGAADTIVTLAGYAVDYPEHRDQVELVISQLVIAMEMAGISSDVCMDKVDKANMSKLCTAEDLTATIQHYNQLGVHSRYEEVSDGLFRVECAETVTGKDGKFYPENKMLKSVAWGEPDWSDPSEWTMGETKAVVESMRD